MQSDYFEADECKEALVAACREFPVAELADEVASWCAKHAEKVSPEIVSQAESLVNLILYDSELKELWSENDGGAEWIGAVENLLHRLTAAK